MSIANPIGPLFDGNDLEAVAIARIQQFEPPEGYYVAFSGGKDSVVLLDLVRRSGVKHDAHYSMTTVDPPELVWFIRKHYPDVQMHRPERTMWQLIVDYGMPPTRIVRYCCRVLKEGGGVGRMVLTGVRWEESARRSRRGMVELCRTGRKGNLIHPIIDWSEKDIWEHIRRHEIPYCSLYDEGFKRLGCVLCPMADKQRPLHAIRWPKIADAYKRAFQRAIDAERPEGRKFRSGKDGQEMFDWWLYGNPEEENEDQFSLFE